ncbi:RseP-like RIP metalloprotease [Rickettsiales endosymbiont of Paramecium tredecaurelia]|uniref:M50 family metallopeptidase n=1 Tax=Candidatus Sarmatiella mevalonica TaxID=2770581 RepID=UPI0019217069|nr:M50 family metallopeptidase [Candidatus Sarmatiella mevalonica]MBL3284213.1 RseP-like RIP metalloprotease [Candidatus Sarmatiella mevalonica]
MYSIFALLLIVVSHELGHYFLAILNNVKVIEFSIGFGKKILYTSFGNGTQWQIRLIPLGGFVSLHGYHGTDINDSSAFCNKSLMARFAIVVAGPLANFILAFILLFSHYFHDGVPQIGNVVDGVVPSSYAQMVGVKKGDTLLSVNNIPLDEKSGTTKIIKKAISSKLPILMQFRRANNSSYTLQIEPEALEEKQIIGIVFKYTSGSPHQFFSSISTTVHHIATQTQDIIRQLYRAFTTHQYSQINGIISVYTAASDLSKNNNTFWGAFLMLATTLSINLAIFNLLPIPPFDGGKLFLMSLELLLPKQFILVLEKIMGWIGSALVLFLLVISLLNDINAL